jgi:hypothetical protein
MRRYLPNTAIRTKTTKRGQPGALKVDLLTLDDIDGRSRSHRIALSMRDQLIVDLGGDPSTAQAALTQRASVLHALLEDLEAKWLQSGNLDIPIYCSAAAEQRRMLVTLGLKRVPRTVELGSYIAEKDKAA